MGTWVNLYDLYPFLFPGAQFKIMTTGNLKCDSLTVTKPECMPKGLNFQYKVQKN